MKYANFTYLHNSTRMLCGYFSVLTTATHLLFQFLAQPGRIYVTSDSHTKLPLCLKYPKLNQDKIPSCHVKNKTYGWCLTNLLLLEVCEFMLHIICKLQD